MRILKWTGPALLALALAGPGAKAAPPLPSEVHVDGGWVQGVSSADNDLAVFKGIPFARPPVGDLRWRAPQQAASWSGLKAADRFGPACMQPNPRGDTPVSEDCLYLNIWAPRAPAAEKRAVMVWIYGGGFRGGAGSQPLFDGAALARKGVVLVTINYRLGKFGFMAHPELTAESAHHASGNYGLMDQLAALQWVRNNISAFGGDPAKVTIFGQSAGGHSVNYLVASPLGKGLFARAIGESAGGFAPATARTYFGHTLRSLKLSEQSGLRLAAAFGAKSIADLRKVPAQDILAAPTLDDDDMGWVMQDGYVLPDTVDHIFAQGRQNDVPVIMGFNSNEGASFAHERSLKAFDAQTAKDMGGRAAEYARLYPASDDVSATKASEMAARDNHFGWQTWTWARLQTATGKSPIYWFYFDVHPPIPDSDPSVKREPVDWGAHHGAEIPYVFGTFYPNAWAWTARDRRLSAVVSDYWVNFAKTGDPNGAGLAPWKPFDPRRPARMDFDEAPSQRPVANLEHLAFWDSLAKP
jgi:para-nitrobenzyl esterase